MLTTTLNFLIDEERILLAMKKRSFGEGKWNGVGGKLMPNESIESSLVRETEEEIGVKVKENNLEKVAIINFYFDDKPDWDQECHVFISKKWEGNPTESEEMKPEWFNFSLIPYNYMWTDDKYWLPLVLEGKKIRAEFHFTEGGKKFNKWKVEEWKD